MHINYKLEDLSAAEIGHLVNTRLIKPTEVLTYFEDRITRLNKSINAFVYTKFDEAYTIALKQEELLSQGEVLGPFAGVPFALKDFLPDKPGWTNSHGGVKCLIQEDTVYSQFCEAMEQAGGIAIGKTNAPSYGFRGTTDNLLYGPTSTPFNLAYNAGGSSGGSAAAVASGLVPIAEGGDAGGSIRIPASFNNLFGFKAGLGTIPSINRPDAYSASHPFCFNGGLTKTVEDAAILLEYMAQFNPLDPYLRKQTIIYTHEMNKPISHLRIAYTPNFDIFPVEDEVTSSFLKTLKNYQALGCTLEEVHFNWHYTALELAKAWCMGITIDPAIDLNKEALNGHDYLKDYPNDFPKEFIYWKNICDKLTIMDLSKFNLIRSDVLENFTTIFKDYDIILSPISNVTSIKNTINTQGPTSINNQEIEPLIGWTQTFLANFVGYPAASIPAGFSHNNIPFGIQAISPLYTESTLLALAHSYEAMFPWRDKYPKLN